jgi:AcrR family transcriptional regulator
LARPTIIDDELLLAVASKLFSERGLSVTTAEIARDAGVSEGSIFRRYKSKSELFVAAMTGTEVGWLDWLDESALDQPLRANLVRFSEAAIDHLLRALPKFYMLVGSGIVQACDVSQKFDVPPPIYVIRSLTRYLELERRAGRVKAVDPEVVARSLVGAVHNYAFFEIMGLNNIQPMPRETFVRGLVELTLSGVAQEST